MWMDAGVNCLSRLCRVMCGRPVAFLRTYHFLFATPQAGEAQHVPVASHSRPALAECHRRPIHLTNRFNGFVIAEKPLKGLGRKQLPLTTQLKQGVNQRPLGSNPLRPLRLGLALLSLTILVGCQAASSRPTTPPETVSVGTLTKDYRESNSDTRRKYDGKEITVKGLAVMNAMMPPSAGDQGLVFLEEKGATPPRRVACWFSKDQAEQFSKVMAGQFITVKGVFNGDAGADLKFCKLVTIE